MIVVETPRLLIRNFEPGDEVAMEQVFGDPAVMEFSEGVRSASWVADFIEQNREENIPESGIIKWAVVTREDNAVIGYCGLFVFDEPDQRPETELGYRYRESAWGKGYATEAARAVVNHTFRQIGINRLAAFIDPGNTGSVRVVEKLGFHYEYDLLRPGYTHPDRVYILESNH